MPRKKFRWQREGVRKKMADQGTESIYDNSGLGRYFADINRAAPRQTDQ